MPIQLATTFKVGDFDEENYTIIKVLKFFWDNVNKTMTLWAYYGRVAGGKFKAGKRDPIVIEIVDRPAMGIEGEAGYVPADPQYTALILSAIANANENVYGAVQRYLYQWLLDRGHFTGTLV